ncbi:3-deoxy-7-phosphoheptulonate synthase [Streptomyces sp. NPDC046876]|uniref:3-deoxy-7-phosphoheptulonate synthase n=1 Tax=Streptomyces sp. NPDC046876 TaxID=3155616 RepID=UPI0033E06E42
MSTSLHTRPTPAAPAWTPGDWRRAPAAQQPAWPYEPAVAAVRRELAALPGLVTASETYTLRRELARAAQARAFVVQAGDCAETFDGPDPARLEARIDLFRTVCRTIGDALGMPVVPVGRIAGQYAKPRSSPVELVDGVELPSFRGHLVNDPEPVAALRAPDPDRMRRGYEHAAATLGLLRSSSAYGNTMRGHWGTGTPAVWTSHEALLLDYEEPLVRRDCDSDDWVLTSTHLPWIGERTRRPDGAHVRFLSGIVNPVGCKVGPATTPEDLLAVCAALDPGRQPGRLTLIARMGADEVARRLPGLVAAVARAGHPVLWMCDPMHGNTVQAPTGHKTRHMAAVLAELEGFFTAVRGAGGWPGGIHLESTAEAVTECVGGACGITEEDLPHHYATACDPRLNGDQTREVARHVAALAHRP